MPPIPFAHSFPELNLRTYVRDKRTGTPGVYFLSLDASNLLAVAFARAYLQPPLPLGRDADRAALGAGVLVLQPAPRDREAGDFQGALSRARAQPETCREPQRVPRIFPDRTLLPVYPQPGRRADAGQASTTSRGRWKKLKPRSSRTISLPRWGSKFPTRTLCCIIPADSRYMCGNSSACPLFAPRREFQPPRCLRSSRIPGQLRSL